MICEGSPNASCECPLHLMKLNAWICPVIQSTYSHNKHFQEKMSRYMYSDSPCFKYMLVASTYRAVVQLVSSSSSSLFQVSILSACQVKKQLLNFLQYICMCDISLQHYYIPSDASVAFHSCDYSY